MNQYWFVTHKHEICVEVINGQVVGQIVRPTNERDWIENRLLDELELGGLSPTDAMALARDIRLQGFDRTQANVDINGQVMFFGLVSPTDTTVARAATLPAYLTP